MPKRNPPSILRRNRALLPSPADAMDDELKTLMKRLGQVINEALTESPKINVAIQSVRDAGYEVFLIIEASIGFNKKERGEHEVVSGAIPDVKERVRLRITPDDVKFLKSLKISTDSDPD